MQEGDLKSALDPLQDKLFASRKIILCEEIEQKMAKRMVGQLLTLAEDSDEPIYMFLNSQGGHVESADSIYDIIQFIKPKVVMIGTGWVASAGTHIFLAAEKEDRYCLPNTRFMIHQPLGGIGGPATDVAIQAQQMLKTRDRLAQVISDRTGQDLERVKQDIDRDTWMDPDEAIEYGMVSKVVQHAQEVF